MLPFQDLSCLSSRESPPFCPTRTNDPRLHLKSCGILKRHFDTVVLSATRPPGPLRPSTCAKRIGSALSPSRFTPYKSSSAPLQRQSPVLRIHLLLHRVVEDRRCGGGGGVAGVRASSSCSVHCLRFLSVVAAGREGGRERAALVQL